MAGTYNGSLHDFGSGNLSVSFAKQAAILDKGRRNAVQAAQATGKAVASADGRRLLALPPRRDPRDYASGPGLGVAGRAPSSGPGVAGVGVAPTSGPGVPVVGAAPTSGAGTMRFGAAVTAGAGSGGVVMAGSGDWFAGPELSVGLGQDQDQATAYKQFGIWIQPSPLFSDAKFFEDRAGDDGPGSWLNNTLTPLADYGNTAVLGMRYHVLGDLNRATEGMKPVPGGVWGGGASPYPDAAWQRGGRVTGGGF